MNWKLYYMNPPTTPVYATAPTLLEVLRSHVAIWERVVRHGYRIAALLVVVVGLVLITGLTVSALGFQQASQGLQELEGQAKKLNAAILRHVSHGGSLTGATATQVLERLHATAHSPDEDLSVELVNAASDAAWSLLYDGANTVFKLEPGAHGYGVRSKSVPAPPAVASVPPPLRRLQPPILSDAGGSLSLAHLPWFVSVVDPNPVGAGEIFYRFNEGKWLKFASQITLPQTAATQLDIYAAPAAAGWESSVLVTAHYTLEPVPAKLESAEIPAPAKPEEPPATPLLPPTFSKPAGTYAATDYPLSVALADPNPPGFSRLVYRQRGGAWTDYQEPIMIAAAQRDLTLETKALPAAGQPRLVSPARQGRYHLSKCPLKPPVVTPPGGYYAYQQFPTSLTIDNPNPPESSELWYRLGNEGPFVRYDPNQPLKLSRETYLTSLTTYTQSLLPDIFDDSTEACELYETIYFQAAIAGSITASEAQARKLAAETNVFKWGDGSARAGHVQSWVKFTGNPSFQLAPGSWGPLGTLEFFNGSSATAAGPTSLALQLALQLHHPAEALLSGTQMLEIVNTPNRGTPEENADGLLLPASSMAFTTSVSGKNFQLEVRFGHRTGEGWGQLADFRVYEGKAAQVVLEGRLTEVPKPEPTAFTARWGDPETPMAARTVVAPSLLGP